MPFGVQFPDCPLTHIEKGCIGIALHVCEQDNGLGGLGGDSALVLRTTTFDYILLDSRGEG
jgi:hypothetical protein